MGLPMQSKGSAVADATKEQGIPAWGDTEVTLMSCKLIFPKITLGASTAAQTPPTPLGPRSCQTPRRAGPGARPGLSSLGAGRAWPPSSHGRIRPCCPSLSPARPRSRPHPSQGCRSRGSIRETQGWGCSSPDSKAQLTSLQNDTEDGDTPQGWSRNLGQGISSGALPASPTLPSTAGACRGTLPTSHLILDTRDGNRYQNCAFTVCVGGNTFLIRFSLPPACHTGPL